MKYRDTYRKKKYGFTLVEVVVVLVISAIIAAFAVPGITSYLDNARKTRQEQTVRLLYSAAQNRLTYISANDPEKYGTFCGLFEAASYQDESGKLCQAAGTGAAGADVELGKMDSERFKNVTCYPAEKLADDETSNGAKAVQLLLGESGLTNVIERGYIKLDIDPSLRFILRVTYQETHLDFPSIYNDSNVDVPPGANPVMETPKLNVSAKNAEKLTVRVTCGSLSEFSPDSDSYKLSVVMTGMSSGSEMTVRPEELTNKKWYSPNSSAGTYDVTLTLDSLDTEMGFPELFKDFDPGEDVKVAVRLSYDGALTDADGNPITVAPSAEYAVVVNSMFAGVNGDTASISCGRHLQNLQDAPAGITKVVQSGDIDWKKTQGAYSEEIPSLTLNPITNAAITSFSGMKSTTQHTISNLVIDGAGADGNTGMFDSSGAAFENVRLVNPAVRNGKGNAGALVGELTSGGSISDCRAFITDTANLSSYSVTTTSGNAGGLVGAASAGTTIENSFAALYQVSGSGNAGGLVGSFEGASITNSYADTKTITGQNAGGLAGSISGTVSHSYAVTEVLKGTTTSAGFAASNSGSIKNSYALVGSVLTESSSGSKYGFAPTGGTVEDTCHYYASTNFGASGGTGAKETSIQNLSGKMTGWAPTGASHPYETSDKYSYMADTAAYPAPFIAGLDHYGNWPEPAAKYTIRFDKNVPDGAVFTPEWSATLAAVNDYSAGEVFTLPGIPEDAEGLVRFSLVGDTTAGFLKWVAQNGDTTVTFAHDVTNPTLNAEQLEALAVLDGENRVVTFKAQWDSIAVRYVLNKNGADAMLTTDQIAALAEKRYPSGTVVTVPEAPAPNYSVVSDGITWVFQGWNTSASAAEADTAYNPGTSFNVPDTDLTLYGVWQRAYHVTYDPNGGIGTQTDNTPYLSGTPVEVKSGEGITRDGYIFLGWSTDKNATDAQYVASNTFPITCDTTLYAVWEQKKVTVRFSQGQPGYYPPAVNAVELNDIQRLPNQSYGTLPELTYNTGLGYSWDGKWYTEAGEEVAADTLVPTGVEEVTLYARWLVTVTFDINGGQWQDDTTSPQRPVSVRYNEPIRVMDVPQPKLLFERDGQGYEFLHWFNALNDSNIAFNFSALISQPISLKAYWYYYEKFDNAGKGKALFLCFDDSGYYMGYYKQGAVKIPQGTCVATTFDSLYTPPSPKPGFVFKGWYTEKNGNGSRVLDENGIALYTYGPISQKPKDGGARLYGYWEPITTP